MTDNNETDRVTADNEEMRQFLENRRKTLLKRPLPPARTVLDSLLTLNKTELDNIRYNLCVQGISSLKKESMAKALAPVVVSFGKDWLKSINSRQFEILQMLSSAGGTSCELDGDDARLEYLRGLGILYGGNIDGQLGWFIPDEIVAEFLANEADIERRVAANERAARLAAGLLFYYGYVPYEQLYKMTGSYISGFNMNIMEFIGVVVNESCWSGKIRSDEQGMYYYLVVDPEVVRQEQNKRRDVGYHQFTYDELYQAGSGDYIAETDELKALVGFFIKECSFDINKALGVVCNLHMILQNNGELSSMIGYLNDNVNITDEDKLKTMMTLLAGLNNTTRLWILRGNRPCDLSKDKDAEVAAASNVVPFVPRDSLVGRNDPCPCGSGKKYKKCCLGKDVQ